jgi:hypothetical protein
MKYDQIILESLQRTTLKKVRIKIDPIDVKSSADLSRCNGYEGYVLAEGQELTKVIIVLPDQDGNMSVIEVPNEHLEILNNAAQNLDALIHFIILSLDVSGDDPLIQNIHACESIDDIEVFLKDRGLSDDDIAEIYKYYIAHE